MFRGSEQLFAALSEGGTGMNRKDWFTACSAVEKEALYRAELENYSEKLVVNGEGRIVFINEKYAAEF